MHIICLKYVVQNQFEVFTKEILMLIAVVIYRC